MNLEAHATIGWMLGHLPPAETRPFRAVITFAAIVPDLDALAWPLGQQIYAHVHHAVGHNIFFSMLVSGLAASLLPGRRMKAFLFTQLAFYLHYFGDYFFTRFPLRFFWPITEQEFIYGYYIGLDHPINITFSYLSFVAVIAIAMLYRRTPVELVAPELDRRLINLFRRRPHTCHLCRRGSNECCEICGQFVCMSHAPITRRFTVRCPACRQPSAIVPPTESPAPRTRDRASSSIE